MHTELCAAAALRVVTTAAYLLERDFPVDEVSIVSDGALGHVIFSKGTSPQRNNGMCEYPLDVRLAASDELMQIGRMSGPDLFTLLGSNANGENGQELNNDRVLFSAENSAILHRILILPGMRETVQSSDGNGGWNDIADRCGACKSETGHTSSCALSPPQEAHILQKMLQG